MGQPDAFTGSCAYGVLQCAMIDDSCDKGAATDSDQKMEGAETYGVASSGAVSDYGSKSPSKVAACDCAAGGKSGKDSSFLKSYSSELGAKFPDGCNAGKGELAMSKQTMFGKGYPPPTNVNKVQGSAIQKLPAGSAIKSQPAMKDQMKSVSPTGQSKGKP
jgi:hypothetical protein